MSLTVKYFWLSVVVVVAVGLTSCGPPIVIGRPDPCGARGQQCCVWPNACNDSSLTCSNRICGGCGYEGGPCCNTYSTTTACSNPNLFCNSPPGGPAFVCQACGHIGQPTCVNNLCVTGVAANGRCAEPSAAEAMCNGSMPFLIGIRDRISHCRQDEFPVRANNLSDARMCAESAARSAGLQEIESVVSPDWQYYPFTRTPSINPCETIQIAGYSEEDAEMCARFTFPDNVIARGDRCP